MSVRPRSSPRPRPLDQTEPTSRPVDPSSFSRRAVSPSTFSRRPSARDRSRDGRRRQSRSPVFPTLRSPPEGPARVAIGPVTLRSVLREKPSASRREIDNATVFIAGFLSPLPPVANRDPCFPVTRHRIPARRAAESRTRSRTSQSPAAESRKPKEKWPWRPTPSTCR